jgi:hypothetical protein
MKPSAPSRADKLLAAVCARCPVCRRARKKQRGLAYRFVEKAERAVCPFCRAFERVHGRKASSAAPPLATEP